MSGVSLLTSFLAGIASFFSPCVVPLIPSYLTFITGISFQELSDSQKSIRAIVLLNTIFFIIGFSTIFIFLGLFAGYLGRTLIDYKVYIRIIGGIAVILFGLIVSGFLNIKFLEKERRFIFDKKPFGLIGSFIIGAGFAAGWIPCVGPILGSILVMAASRQTFLSALFLLTSYSIGFALPFIFAALFIDVFISNIKKISSITPIISKITGILMVFIGVLLMLNLLSL